MVQAELLQRIVEEVSRFVVGKKRVIEMLLIALLCEGHVLLEGMPGVAKTLLAKTFAQTIGGSFKRVQMTPDLLPADIIGVNVYNPKKGVFTLRKGPIFTNVVLVDELNRAPPKTQAALLEAMQERQVTIEGTTIPLDKPFIVFATQIPYGSPGTYPLTEVEIDRFAFKVDVGLPSFDEEIEIISRIDRIEEVNAKRVSSPQEVIELTAQVKEVYVSERVKEYIVGLVNSLRNGDGVKMGPSPRASIWLLKGSRAKALLDGRSFVIPDDVKAVAPYVLGHRIQLEPDVESEGISTQEIVERALASQPVPKE